jgi:NAD(P)-dependent dehydrogenase (short-subunit alcohol dehydrogenase family)
MHPLGRICEAEDIASAVCWFLDSKNSWLTGQVLGVDGGLADVKAKS